MESFLAGVIAAGHLVAGLFFLRFWARTRDALFAAFACAFCLFALNQALVTLSGIPREEQSWIYLLRVGGFVLIIVGIAAKNMRGRRP
jgi:hypothetical protein